MKKAVGLWIDHKKAVIVSITGKEEKRMTVESDLEKMFRRPQSAKGSGDTHGRYDFPKYDINDRDFRGHLNNYLDKVVRYLRGAEFLLIFGPGESKAELVKRIGKIDPSIFIADIETADKMTDPQISAKVRKYFLKRK